MDLPQDYESCGVCGFDHAYEGITPAIWREIQAAHQEAEAESSALSEEALHLQEAFEHRILGRVKASLQERRRRPLYWLTPSTNGRDRIYLLVAQQIPGDSEFPRSWKENLAPLLDLQLEKALMACLQLCRWGGSDATAEETADAIWHSYEFSPLRWERIQNIMLSLLGEPGERPNE